MALFQTELGQPFLLWFSFSIYSKSVHHFLTHQTISHALFHTTVSDPLSHKCLPGLSYQQCAACDYMRKGVHSRLNNNNAYYWHSQVTSRQVDCHPIQTNWCPHLCHPPIFMPDALPGTILPIYTGFGQAPNVLACNNNKSVMHKYAKQSTKHCKWWLQCIHANISILPDLKLHIRHV